MIKEGFATETENESNATCNSIYQSRGVSADKADVHRSIERVDKGLFPGAFCKIIPDVLGDSLEHCSIMHCDGAGSKAIIAYLYYRETGDASVFRGIAQDSLVMNTDDLLAVGACGPYVLSNSIARNAYYIPSEVLKEIISGYEEQIEQFAKWGIEIITCGGETSDMGDTVRTVLIDSTISTRLRRDAVIDAAQIKPPAVIVGLASSGQANYEKYYNSGIGSNGLTAARHDLLSADYKQEYPEVVDPSLEQSLAYRGPYHLKQSFNDIIHHELDAKLEKQASINLGQALLSPTRSYAPVIEAALKLGGIQAIFHCTGGGQTKCINFGRGLHYVKNNLFSTPPIFNLIQKLSRASSKEMYQVFNMGHRMEVVCAEKTAEQICSLAKDFGIAAQVIGHVEANQNPNQNTVTIRTQKDELSYSKGF